MEFIKVEIGNCEMYIPVNDKLGEMILTADRRLNYKKHIARMRNAYKGRIEYGRVVMTSDFFYALEDVMEEKGYFGVFHHHFEKFPVEQRKILYDLFRDDKTIRYLIAVCGYGEEQVLKTIREFFESLTKIIL